MNGTRRDRFRQRIEFERDILTLINNKLIGVPPLVGLTEVAIERWREDLSAEHELNELNIFLDQLIHISRVLTLASDCSQDIFEEAEVLPERSLESVLSDLDRVVDWLIRDGIRKK